MSELDGIGRVIPGDRSRDQPGKRPPQRKFEEDENPDEKLDEDPDAKPEGESDDSPEDGSKKNRKGREVSPPSKHEEGQIIDILA